VKRQKLHPMRLQELIDYIVAACPTKSGEKSVTYHQYITDDQLYQAYHKDVSQPVCFNTLYKIKQWLRVRHCGRYFGMFDCRKCYRLYQLPTEMAADIGNPALIQELADCRRHQQLNFISAISTA
jgi:hypothetical protein